MYDLSSDIEDYAEHTRGLPVNTALGLALHPQLEDLRAVLAGSIPYCCGTVVLPAESFTLFYGTNEFASRIDLCAVSASQSDLEELEKACDLTTSGADPRDVPNVAYRRAGSLERSHFALNLDVERAGLLEAVRLGLLSGQNEGQAIYAERSGLNVHGRNSFVRTHIHTEQKPGLFGTLVIVFPTAHTGGEFILRHDKKEWAFDAARTLCNLPLLSAPTTVVYLAYRHDVELEVQRVTSGHRVTIIYDLYLAEKLSDSHPYDAIEPGSANLSRVRTMLSTLLSDPTFLPNGGTLGFGLRHLYSLPTSFKHDNNALEELKDSLKGDDAALFHALTHLSLAPSLYAVFEDDSITADDTRTLVACPRVVKFHTHDETKDVPVWQKLCRNFGGVLINASQATLAEAANMEGVPVKNRVVQWVTELSDVNRVLTRFVAYAPEPIHEPMMGYLHQRICLLVDVGLAGQRGGA